MQAEAAAPGLPLGPGRLRRGPQDVRHLLRRRGQVHQALPARPAARAADAPLPADDGHAAQRQGGGLPALHGAARRRPLRGQVPRRRARGRCLRPDAPLVKEELLKFDGTPLFPERIAYTVPYKLSDAEAAALQGGHRLRARGVQPRRGAAERQARGHGRLRADHPAAPAGLLARGDLPVAARRRERLEKRLRELELLQRGAAARASSSAPGPLLDAEDVEDLEEAPDDEVEEAEEEILDQATAARTIAELKAEIATLKRLEALALTVRRSGEDTKWRELASCWRDLHACGEPTASPSHVPDGASRPAEPSPRQKLVIFTEHRDTLNYLRERIATLLGRQEAVVAIHGGMGREERRKAQEAFMHDPEVQVLVATDAAGEGINLQRAHLMVNYDLPWNPNRIEQRFGRIHRIGQTEVCHLWNLVAERRARATSTARCSRSSRRRARRSAARSSTCSASCSSRASRCATC